MAEERIIDDEIDKDKKYRIVRGDDGEDELIINEVEEPEELLFRSEDDLIEDEDSGVFTAEQYEAARILKEEEDARRQKELEELREKVHTYMENDRFSDALECVEYADENELNDGGFTCVKLEAVTRKFTDYSERKTVMSAAKEVSAKTTPEQHSRLYETYGDGIRAAIAENEVQLSGINEKYEAEQQSRREILAPRKKKALRNLIIVFAVFAVFLAAAIACSTQMFSTQSPVLVIVTIVLGVIALIVLIAMIFFLRAFVGAAHMSASNEKDKSTKLGRERRELVLYGETLNAVLDAISSEQAETAEEAAE